MTQQDRMFQMRASGPFLAQIDEWRRGQPDLPNRAEAIHRLVQRGLDAYQAQENELPNTEADWVPVKGGEAW